MNGVNGVIRVRVPVGERTEVHMKIKTITYGMLRKTEQYENDRAEVTLELEPGDDDFGPVVDRAKALCELALGRVTPAQTAATARKAKYAKLRKAAAACNLYIGSADLARFLDVMEGE